MNGKCRNRVQQDLQLPQMHNHFLKQRIVSAPLLVSENTVQWIILGNCQKTQKNMTIQQQQTKMAKDNRLVRDTTPWKIVMRKITRHLQKITTAKEIKEMQEMWSQVSTPTARLHKKDFQMQPQEMPTLGNGKVAKNFKPMMTLKDLAKQRLQSSETRCCEG
eukprot:Seg206.1 transcript_id=Seg206.1/GoldUCD/mRNA.D3Y31 product="hypothetical protein" protein_id=Seg206.1/GoldUCD/D3Y31